MRCATLSRDIQIHDTDSGTTVLDLYQILAIDQSGAGVYARQFVVFCRTVGTEEAVLVSAQNHVHLRDLRQRISTVVIHIGRCLTSHTGMCQNQHNVCSCRLQILGLLRRRCHNIIYRQNTGIVGSLLGQHRRRHTDQSHIDRHTAATGRSQGTLDDPVPGPDILSGIGISYIGQYYLVRQSGTVELIFQIFQRVIKLMITKRDRIISHLRHGLVDRLDLLFIGTVDIICRVIIQIVSQVKLQGITRRHLCPGLFHQCIALCQTAVGKQGCSLFIIHIGDLSMHIRGKQDAHPGCIAPLGLGRPADAHTAKQADDHCQDQQPRHTLFLHIT